MEKRRRPIRHSLLLLLAVVMAGCMGGEEARMEIAYGVVRDDVPTRIVVVEDDGTDGRRVTGARRGEPPVLPRWSPDGSRIAFVRFNPMGGPGSLQTYVVNADGSGERRLGEGTLPEWTPDGRSVVVEQSAAPPRPSEVHVLSAAGSDDRKLTNGSAPAVSHDGTRVAFVRYAYRRRPNGGLVTTSSLYTISLDGTGLRLLARSVGRDIRWVQPSWLPDDSAVAVAQRTGSVVASGPLLTFSMSGRRRQLVPKVGETYDWSPLGDLVAYTERGILFIVRPDGTEVNSYGQSNAIDVEFSPDGKRVAYSVQEVVQTDVTFVGLYVIDLEKEVRRRFALAEGFVGYLDWRPLPPEDQS